MITLLAIKSTIYKTFVWMKQYSEFVLGAVILALVILLMGKKRAPDFSKWISELRDKHEKELLAIKVSEETEQREIREVELRTTKALKEVEEKYKKEKRTLDRAAKKEITKAIKENNNNPNYITRRIAELTGVTVVID